MDTPTIFISYSNQDAEWKDRLVTHLGVLQQQNQLNFWTDESIGIGDKWLQEIETAMDTADVAIFLVSAYSLTSEFILRKEIKKLLERRDKEGVTIFPILVRPCAWRTVPWLAELQLRPRGGVPLSAGTDYEIDENLTAIVEEIDATLKEIPVPPAPPPSQGQPPDPPIAPSLKEEESPQAERPQPESKPAIQIPQDGANKHTEKRIAPWVYAVVVLSLIGLGYFFSTLPQGKQSQEPPVVTPAPAPSLPKQPQQEGRKSEEKPPVPMKSTPPPAVQVQPEPKDKTDSNTQRNKKDGKIIVRVPVGEFLMGCNTKFDTECRDNEKVNEAGTPKSVFLDEFWIDQTEVTVDEYRNCIKGGGCGDKGLTKYKDCNWNKDGRDNHPINCVDWSQAQDYCAWAEKRLPTEAEWEKAARGTNGQKYPWGNLGFQNAGKVANITGDADGYSTTAPTGSFPEGKSPYNAFDMIGNVWEWTNDWYGADYYKRLPEKNPKGPETGDFRVLRGGSWVGNASFARVSSRTWLPPGTRVNGVGFRCAR